MQGASESVHFIIGRMTRVQTPDILRSSPSRESLLNFSVYSADALFSYFPFKEFPEKIVAITKVRVHRELSTGQSNLQNIGVDC